MLLEDNKKCTGCRACEQACPANCIQMMYDQEGFLVPKIEHKNCINCKICETICHLNDDYHTNNPICCYAMKSKDKDLLAHSTSGGIATVLAKWMIEQGGYVVGSSLDDYFNVKHIVISEKDDLKKIQGSKYVQSDTAHTYSMTNELLKKNRAVLYIGTPCQIAGLKAFTKKTAASKLITVELICHGVPSNILFKKYISAIEHDAKGQIMEYNFRSKEKNGWGLTCGYSVMHKGKIKRFEQSAVLDRYNAAFLDCMTYRECCYTCKYAKERRCSDITLGDYWGIENVIPSFDSSVGVSAVLVNSKKGREMINSILEEVDYSETVLDDICKYNMNLKEPSKRPLNRNQIYNELNSIDDFKKRFKTKIHIKSRVGDILPLKAKKKIKNMIAIMLGNMRKN